MLATEATNTRRPLGPFNRSPIAAREHSNAAVRLVPMIRSQLSRVILWNGALSAIPALTTNRSIGPFSVRASSNALAICSASVTSHPTAIPPCASATTCSGSMRRPSSDSFAPAALRHSAAAAPMPVPPPVISAWRPASGDSAAILSPNDFSIGRSAFRWQGGSNEGRDPRNRTPAGNACRPVRRLSGDVRPAARAGLRDRVYRRRGGRAAGPCDARGLPHYRLASGRVRAAAVARAADAVRPLAAGFENGWHLLRPPGHGRGFGWTC